MRFDKGRGRVLDDAANLFLGVEEAIGALLLQQGKLFALHPEALIFREVPMEDVELDRFHAVEGAIHHIEGHEMAARVQHQSAPGKARLIVDSHCRNDEASWRDTDELQKGLQAVQHAQRIGGFEVHLVGCNLQMIGLIFIDLLHGCARPRGLDEEQRFIEHSLAPQGNPGLPREDVQKALFGAFQAWLLITFESHAEAIVDEELARARLHLRRKRH